MFERSARPDSAMVRELASRSSEFAVSHDPGNGSWLELIANGLTFDLQGLAPGEASPLPPHPNLFELPPGFNQERYAAVTLEPGPHVAAGSAMMPVIRSQMWLAGQLCELPGVAAIGWRPARTMSGPGHFRGSVRRWLEGGPFPGFGLAALLPVPDGGMQSEGLAFFTRQELRIEPELAADGSAVARIAVRLLHDLVEHGPLETARPATGPGGEALRLAPSPNRRFVRVSRM